MEGLTRREFLVATGAAAASAAIVPAGFAASGREPVATPAVPKRTLRKAVMYGMVGEGASVMERFKLLRDCGFEGVEMDSPSDIPAAEILEAQSKTGLIVHGLVDSAHWSKPLNHPSEKVQKEALEALRTCLRDAKTFGSVSILLVPGVVNNDFPYDDCYTRSQAMIKSVLPLAKECNVKIAIENVWNGFLLSPLEAAKYVDDFNDPMVAFHFDIGNVINFGRPAQWARILGKRIAKLHIKDFSLKKRDNEGLWKGFSVELGDGDAGWADVMKALDDSGYATAKGGNWATAEVGGGDRTRLKQISDQMDKLFAM